MSQTGAKRARSPASWFETTARCEHCRAPGSSLGFDVGPGQVGFSPDGRSLVVTERHTNLIKVFPVRRDGAVKPPSVHASSGAVPFGFAFDSEARLFVSEAQGGNPGSALSSYALGAGRLTPISASVNTTELAACWVTISADGRFAYTTNMPSGTVSGFRIDPAGAVDLLHPDGVTADIGAGTAPTDLVATSERYLYTLNSREGSVAALRIGREGGLRETSRLGGLPPDTTGLISGASTAGPESR